MVLYTDCDSIKNQVMTMFKKIYQQLTGFRTDIHIRIRLLHHLVGMEHLEAPSKVMWFLKQYWRRRLCLIWLLPLWLCFRSHQQPQRLLKILQDMPQGLEQHGLQQALEYTISCQRRTAIRSRGSTSIYAMNGMRIRLIVATKKSVQRMYIGLRHNQFWRCFYNRFVSMVPRLCA